MDKSAIKKFAVTARNKLMETVEQRAFELGITKNAIKEAEVYQDGFLINQIYYKQYQIKQRNDLIREMEHKGFEQVIEEVAYTWFNRFIALRYMEVNDYLPSGVRIFSSIEPGKTEPDALTEVLLLIDELDLDEQKVYELQDANDDEDLFKYILIKQCNKLGEIMPMMFEKIEDYTELLLPNQLLAETSVIHDMVTVIDEDDWKQEVEIIGWLYQYYISEKKDEVFAGLKKNKKITKENIPAATELFTPRWIVQYMVDNSLGRLWLESHENRDLQEKLPYYLEAADQPEHVIEQLDIFKNPNLKPESIKFFDPCMGSGHILVYAFEVFFELYKSQGYREQDIPRLILENNLYGLDIDPRAAQLAYFSVMMKARGYNYRIFESLIETNIHWIDESNGITEQDVAMFAEASDLKEDLHVLIDTFEDGRLYGSIIEMPDIDLMGLKEQANKLKEAEVDDIFAIDFKEYVLPVIESLIDQAIILARKYDVVVTNPPYMGRKGMNAELSKYVKENYKKSSADLYAVFMEVASHSAKENGFIALINQHSWMFLSSFEKLRKEMLEKHQIYSMAHLGTRAFSEIGGEVVQTTSFVMRKGVIKDYLATFIRLTDFDDAEEKALHFYDEALHFKRTQDGFSDIPGSPVAYWASEQTRRIFRNSKKMSEMAIPKQGMATANNNRFLRLWFEVRFKKIEFNYCDKESAKENNKKWVPYNKGGGYRKWYGNKDYVVNWKNDGEEIKNYIIDRYPYLKGNYSFVIKNEKYYFQKGLTWSDINSSNLSVRINERGVLFSDVGNIIFPINVNEGYLHAYLNSKVTIILSNLITSTIHFKPGNMEQLPIIIDYSNLDIIKKMVRKNISISKSDWDSFETSWDFQTHPFLEIKRDTTKIADAFFNWQQEAENRFQALKANEEELNRIFIDLYGLQDELAPEVEDKDVTVSRADQERDVKSFLSYAVGVMFGRYSLDEEGLAFAGGKFTMDKYQTFKPDTDNVIPITDDTYFEDDIVTRLTKFLKIVFGDEHVEENLDFIADTLTRKANETSRQRIRRYFLKEFYKDHVQTYQKRPIYWLFDSGRQNGFKALIYLHRYDKDLVAKIRTNYLHEQQRKYKEEIDRLDKIEEADIPNQEKTRAKKRKEKLQKQLLECQNYDQIIAHVASQKLELDLDDGVKVNYAKFQNVEIPQGEGKKPLKGNLLAKI